MGCLFLTHFFGVTPYIQEGEILPKETAYIPVTYGAKLQAYCDTLNSLDVTHECDRQTDVLSCL